MNTFENGFVDELEKIARIPSVHREAVTKALKDPNTGSAIRALPEGVQSRAGAKRWGNVTAKHIATPTATYERAWNETDNSGKNYMRNMLGEDIQSGADLKKAQIADAKSLGRAEASRYTDKTPQPSLAERLAAHKRSKAPPPPPSGSRSSGGILSKFLRGFSSDSDWSQYFDQHRKKKR